MERKLRLRTPDRRQLTLRPENLDDIIPMDHPARTVWRVAEGLDLSKFYEGIQSVEGEVGRDATDPRLLVALWLYATMKGVGSARELARLCTVHDAYRWLVGGVSLNHHLLSDFRVGYADELDELFTQLLARLIKKGVVDISSITQDGTRVRASAGASSFRREKSLGRLLKEAKRHVKELRKQIDDAARSGELSSKQRAARERAAREKEQLVQEALSELPSLKVRREKLSRKIESAGKKELRVSTTDPEARVMKMPDGGYRPAYNVQYAADTKSRAIVGVEVTNSGVDTGALVPMRQQIEERTGRKIEEHLADSGYLTLDDIEQGSKNKVTMYIPPKPPRANSARMADPSLPRPTDTEAIKEWRLRMASDDGKEHYKMRAAVSETVNAEAKTLRGLSAFRVRGVTKAQCIALWAALAYNIAHFGSVLI